MDTSKPYNLMISNLEDNSIIHATLLACNKDYIVLAQDHKLYYFFRQTGLSFYPNKYTKLSFQQLQIFQNEIPEKYIFTGESLMNLPKITSISTCQGTLILEFNSNHWIEKPIPRIVNECSDDFIFDKKMIRFQINFVNNRSLDYKVTHEKFDEIVSDMINYQKNAITIVLQDGLKHVISKHHISDIIELSYD